MWARLLGGGVVLIYIVCCVLSHFSRVRIFVTLWTVARQAPLYMRFSKQEYQRGWPCSLPGDLPHPGIKPTFMSLHWQVDSLPLVPPGKPCVCVCVCVCVCRHIYVYIYVYVCVLTLSFVKVIFLTVIRWALYKTDLKFLFFLTQKITDVYKE